MNFKDHFSARAALYAAYRPLYPASLFDFVAGLTADHKLALDCATGNGQAATGLATHFDRVIATDASVDQIRNAASHPRIEYRVAPAESSGLAPATVNLVTAAQSLHWLEPESFFAEVKRVLARDGALAIWGYGDPMLDDDVLHKTLFDFNHGTLERYWTAERSLLLDGYRTIPFPFPEVEAPRLELQMCWTLPELAGYLRTWSATSRYVAQHGVDPVIEVEHALAAHWGDPVIPRLIRWPLYIRAGRR